MSFLGRFLGSNERSVARQEVRRIGLCLIAYCRFEYFEQVLDSLLSQRISGRPFTDFFDLYIFQDGLVGTESAEEIDGHQKIKDLCRTQLGDATIFCADANLGVANIFDRAERTMFLERQNPWAAFFEDDMVLSQGYLELLWQMSQQFSGEDRIGMFCCSTGHFLPQKVQLEQASLLIPMQHHWGFGLKRNAWLTIAPLVKEYLKLCGLSNYRNRPHRLIQTYQQFCGFNPGSSSQDYFKSAALAASGFLRVSSCINLGRYIGQNGLYFTPEIFVEKGFDKTVIFDGELPTQFDISDERLKSLGVEQCKMLLQTTEHDFTLFRAHINHGNYSENFFKQRGSAEISESDVVAAYKIFLNRLPESQKAIDAHSIVSAEKLLINFLTSPEFLRRKEFWPVLIRIAQALTQHSKKSGSA